MKEPLEPLKLDVLHCFNTKSDKIYVIYSYKEIGGFYEVKCFWGRRGKKLKEQIKKRSTKKSDVIEQHKQIKNEKLKKEYKEVSYEAIIDVEWSSYFEEYELEKISKLCRGNTKPSQKIEKVKCIDNDGQENELMVGEIYNAISGDEYLCTIEINGKELSVLKSRFEKV